MTNFLVESKGKLKNVICLDLLEFFNYLIKTNATPRGCKITVLEFEGKNLDDNHHLNFYLQTMDFIQDFREREKISFSDLDPEQMEAYKSMVKEFI